jgi:hypothetical protein
MFFFFKATKHASISVTLEEKLFTYYETRNNFVHTIFGAKVTVDQANKRDRVQLITAFFDEARVSFSLLHCQLF